jgi:hypothetical protein
MYIYTIKIKNSGVAIATVCHHMDPPLHSSGFLEGAAHINLVKSQAMYRTNVSLKVLRENRINSHIVN